MNNSIYYLSLMKLDKLNINNLREHLIDKDKFIKLSNFFIRSSFEEIKKEISNPDLLKLIKLEMEVITHNNIGIVFSFSESPIEIIFLNSLFLCFLKNKMPLIMKPPIDDALKQITDFKNHLNYLDNFITWYLNKYGNYSNIFAFLRNEVNIGKMNIEELPYMNKLVCNYNLLNHSNAYHLTIQAGFPDMLIGRKSIRVDMFFWIPFKSDLNLIVECDGYKFHSDKDSFTQDRKRDRILKSKNFEVMRYSGSEIHNDPIGTASDLFDYLLKRMSNGDE
jgi:hypothetical protein